MHAIANIWLKNASRTWTENGLAKSTRTLPKSPLRILIIAMHAPPKDSFFFCRPCSNSSADTFHQSFAPKDASLLAQHIQQSIHAIHTLGTKSNTHTTPRQCPPTVWRKCNVKDSPGTLSPSHVIIVFHPMIHCRFQKHLKTEMNSNNETKCNICNQPHFGHENSEAFSTGNTLI